MVSAAPIPFERALAEARAHGQPRAWRRPLGGPPAAADEVFAWLRDAADDGTLAAARARLRVYNAAGPLEVRPAHYPRPHDATIAGWLARLGADHGECGVVVNNLQAASPAAWRAALALLALLHRERAPVGGASFDLFTGAYRRGFFGVHKDDQDVVTFVVEGHKRFYLWPFERFAERPGAAPATELGVHLLTDLDPAPHLADALVLEGGPGDVFYWPAEWWHLAASDGELCTTVGVGLFRGHSVLRFAEEAAQRRIEEDPAAFADALALPSPAAGGDATAALTAADAAVDALLADDELRARLAERVLASASAFGCGRLPAPRRDPLPAGPLRLAAPGALPWTARGGELVWAVGGEAARYPDLPPLRALFARVGAGAPFVADDLARELADPSVAADALRHVLARIHAHHGLVPA